MFESANTYWKNHTKDKIDPDWAKNINEYEGDLALIHKGKVEDKVFAETRLRMGAYGQRYDNGKRHDGQESREIPFPDHDLKKGVDTFYHAPGMERIKLPFGRITCDQIETIADCAEEYSDCIIHITTRQDIQMHFCHIDDTPAMFRRLAAVGITTQEACGNSVRNITGCPVTGVCKDQAFDVSLYADTLFKFLLGHPDAQDFGRKVKIAFSGCADKPCGLVHIHDIGYIAKTRKTEHGIERGFEMWVGGGLGAVPYQAKCYSEFLTMDEFLPTVQALCRVYARLGEKKKRHMARLKFLVAKLGIDKLRELVQEEIKILKPDTKWQSLLPDPQGSWDQPLLNLQAPAILPADSNLVKNPSYITWLQTSVKKQAQPGYSVVTIRLPLGDCTSEQFRALGGVARKFVGDSLRTTVEQNMVMRWVRDLDLPALYEALAPIDMVRPHAESVIDITSCPGTDTCKLGIAASRALASELTRTIQSNPLMVHPEINALKIKVSGCFNSCGQHHLADIGFYGISRVFDGYTVPHFQLTLGGQFVENGKNFALALGGYPSKAVPSVVNTLFEHYIQNRLEGENYRTYLNRVTKKTISALLRDFAEIPVYSDKPEFYTDWGDVREFTMKDKGVGECAGEVVSPTDFGLKKADREYFEAQTLLDDHHIEKAVEKCYYSMYTAALALLKRNNPDASEDPNEVYEQFKIQYHDTKLMHDPFGGDRFVHYYFAAHQARGEKLDAEAAQRRVEEARLFVEAAHSCHIRLGQQLVTEKE